MWRRRGKQWISSRRPFRPSAQSRFTGTGRLSLIVLREAVLYDHSTYQGTPAPRLEECEIVSVFPGVGTRHVSVRVSLCETLNCEQIVRFEVQLLFDQSRSVAGSLLSCRWGPPALSSSCLIRPLERKPSFLSGQQHAV